MTTAVRSWGAVLALTVLGGLCVVPPAAAASDPSRVRVSVDSGTVRVPGTLRPGWHRFVLRVTGSSSDGVQLVRPRAGYSASDYARDVRASAPGLAGDAGQVRRALHRIEANTRMWGGALTEAGSTVVLWQKTPRGRLFVVSQGHPQEPKVVKVTGAMLPGGPPVAIATATVGDGSLSLSRPALPRTGILEVRNAGTSDHVVGLAKLVPGRTTADVATYFQAMLGVLSGSTADPAQPVSPLDESVFGAVTQALHPGVRQFLRYTLPAGDYAAVCPTFDERTFDLHLLHGEIASATLT